MRYRQPLLCIFALIICASIAACSNNSIAAQPSATAAPTSTPNALPTPIGQLITQPLSIIQMISTSVGWGVTQSSTSTPQQVAYTADGGQSWHDVTPSTFTSGTGTLVLLARSAAEAWVSVNTVPSSNATTSPLWHTTNGGQSWQSSTINTGGVNQITFVDQQHGWIAASPGGHGAGQMPINVWRTTDGGASWAKISQSTPVLGVTQGISFLTATTGWATAAAPGAVLEFSRTQDGGKTWTPQSLPAPVPNFSNFGYSTVDPPVFINATNGILFVELVGGAQGLPAIPYRTTNGGATWTVGPKVGVGGCVWSVISDETAFAGCGESSSMNGSLPHDLFTLPAGGSQWSSIAVDANSKPLTVGMSVLDMVTATDGWAITQAGLIHTTNGGQTWTLQLSATGVAGS
jgi:photosystem II stability/assembly factor-like uncharacterized protein